MADSPNMPEIRTKFDAIHIKLDFLIASMNHINQRQDKKELSIVNATTSTNAIPTNSMSQQQPQFSFQPAPSSTTVISSEVSSGASFVKPAKRPYQKRSLGYWEERKRNALFALPESPPQYSIAKSPPVISVSPPIKTPLGKLVPIQHREAFTRTKHGVQIRNIKRAKVMQTPTRHPVRIAPWIVPTPRSSETEPFAAPEPPVSQNRACLPSTLTSLTTFDIFAVNTDEVNTAPEATTTLPLPEQENSHTPMPIITVLYTEPSSGTPPPEKPGFPTQETSVSSDSPNTEKTTTPVANLEEAASAPSQFINTSLISYADTNTCDLPFPEDRIFHVNLDLQNTTAFECLPHAPQLTITDMLGFDPEDTFSCSPMVSPVVSLSPIEAPGCFDMPPIDSLNTMTLSIPSPKLPYPPRMLAPVPRKRCRSRRPLRSKKSKRAVSSSSSSPSSSSSSTSGEHPGAKTRSLSSSSGSSCSSRSDSSSRRSHSTQRSQSASSEHQSP